jgi:uncharacterized protein (TIGR02145 family)
LCRCDGFLILILILFLILFLFLLLTAEPPSEQSAFSFGNIFKKKEKLLSRVGSNFRKILKMLPTVLQDEGPNENGLNGCGFSGLPAGQRYGIGGYNFIGFGAFRWSSTNSDDLFASYAYLTYFNGMGFTGSEGMRFGLSVRCIKN